MPKEKLLLNVAKAILHEVDGIDGGYDEDSYLSSRLVLDLRAAILHAETGIHEGPAAKELDTPTFVANVMQMTQKKERNEHVNPVFRHILNPLSFELDK